MNLDKNELFSYYHKLRMEEHIPLVPFLNLPEMKFVLVPAILYGSILIVLWKNQNKKIENN